MNSIEEYRKFLKDSIRKEIDFRQSDQSQGIPAPPLELPADEDLPRISLPGLDSLKKTTPKMDLTEAIADRKSRRKYTKVSLTLDELAYLLWATQGQREPGRNTPHFRTVPSAGARHSFESYLFILKVSTLPQGLYRYLPLSNELVLLSEFDKDTVSRLDRAVFGQRFIVNSSVVFVWTTVPYRMEWRYLQAAHRVLLLDAGHVCQNLYLACEAIGAGTCAVAAYDQEAMDELLKIDGQEHFTIYLAPVGKCLT
jgi:SagB-type dehydrogenase family enzyme